MFFTTPHISARRLPPLFRSRGRPDDRRSGDGTPRRDGRHARLDEPGEVWQRENLRRLHAHERFPPLADEVRAGARSEEHTSELQSLRHLVCSLRTEKTTKAK